MIKEKIDKNNLIFTRADKGAGLVIITKDSYREKNLIHEQE